MSYLKSTIASAKGYLRPLQKDIEVDTSQFVNQSQSQVNDNLTLSEINTRQMINSTIRIQYYI